MQGLSWEHLAFFVFPGGEWMDKIENCCKAVEQGAQQTSLNNL